jgi:hypothetical protein
MNVPDNMGVVTTYQEGEDADHPFVSFGPDSTVIPGMVNVLAGLYPNSAYEGAWFPVRVEKNASNWLVGYGQAEYDETDGWRLVLDRAGYRSYLGSISYNDTVQVTVVLTGILVGYSLLPRGALILDQYSSGTLSSLFPFLGFYGNLQNYNALVIPIRSENAIEFTLDNTAGLATYGDPGIYTPIIFEILRAGTGAVSVAPGVGCTINGAADPIAIASQWKGVRVYATTPVDYIVISLG